MSQKYHDAVHQKFPLLNLGVVAPFKSPSLSGCLKVLMIDGKLSKSLPSKQSAVGLFSPHSSDDFFDDHGQSSDEYTKTQPPKQSEGGNRRRNEKVSTNYAPACRQGRNYREFLFWFFRRLPFLHSVRNGKVLKSFVCRKDIVLSKRELRQAIFATTETTTDCTDDLYGNRELASPGQAGCANF